MLLQPRRTIDQIGIELTPTAAAATDKAAVMRLARLITSRPELSRAAPARWDDPTFWNVDDGLERRSQFLAVGNAINFRFWSVREGHVTGLSGKLDGINFSGAMYMWRSLRRAVERDPHALHADHLASIS